MGEKFEWANLNTFQTETRTTLDKVPGVNRHVVSLPSVVSLLALCETDR